ncbi:hypothetical protein [Microcoleus sp. S11D4]
MTVGSWHLAFVCWQLAVGICLLAVDSWQLTVGSWRLTFDICLLAKMSH